MSLRGALAGIASWRLWSPRARRTLLRSAGARVERVRVYPGIRFLGDPRQLSAGPGSFLNAELLIGANAPVRIGERVRIGPRCMLLTTTHELGGPEQRAGEPVAEPVAIEDGCWLGASVTVLGGVTVGRGSVVAAGAVVTEDCAPNGLYGGVPARLIRDLGSPSTKGAAH